MFDDSYRQAIQRVLAFIEHHYDENLTLLQLSKVARISQFHFHRIFTSYMGLSPGQYIKVKRIEHGVRELSHSKKKTIDVALSSGYENHASFNKAFKKELGLNPTEFRQAIKEKGNYMSHLKSNAVEFLGFQNREATPILYVRKTGNYFVSARAAWEEILKTMDKLGIKTNEHEYIGISQDNPHDEDVNEEDLRFDACVVNSQAIQKSDLAKQSVQTGEIAGGRYAVFLHRGPYETLSDSYHYIYGHWMYSENQKVRNVPPFIRYRVLLSLSHCDPKDLESEIFIPVK